MLSPRAEDIKRVAWQQAYSVHVKRAPTEDGSEKEYASRLADRVWPIYIIEGEVTW